MRCLVYILILLALSHMTPGQAENSCCEQDNDTCEKPLRSHVKLFFSGSPPEETVHEPRENYEWPGMNEDSFYDYFTK